MKTYRCDRCGELYDFMQGKVKIEGETKGNYPNEYDLCSVCSRQFKVLSNKWWARDKILIKILHNNLNAADSK